MSTGQKLELQEEQEFIVLVPIKIKFAIDTIDTMINNSVIRISYDNRSLEDATITIKSAINRTLMKKMPDKHINTMIDYCTKALDLHIYFYLEKQDANAQEFKGNQEFEILVPIKIGFRITEILTHPDDATKVQTVSIEYDRTNLNEQRKVISKAVGKALIKKLPGYVISRYEFPFNEIKLYKWFYFEKQGDK